MNKAVSKKSAAPVDVSPDKSVNTSQGATKQLYLSHFTPSMMPPATLEAMLVQREPILSRAVQHVVDSLHSGGRHHALFVGPRGIGKTHLISLLHHRLMQAPIVGEKAIVLWMREEEWGITSFFELMLRILRNLNAAQPELGIKDLTALLYDLSIKEAEKAAEQILLNLIGKKCLVLLLENLDDLFEQMGDQGQKAWRAFIQNHSNMMLVCTTPSLFAGVSLQKSAFYGFFDIELLKKLAFEDVVSLLKKIALERNDIKLADYIETPSGRGRIRAVHHLAEGNPRIYIIFAQFLNQEALDELVQAFMHTLDELTPYYQAKMKELSGQQRKIVEYLIHYRGAATVKQIAKACFISPQSCSSQLKILKERRVVRSTEEGRESYYELYETLMRICMEVKQQRGEPIELVVDFLRLWFTLQDLEIWFNKIKNQNLTEKKYISKAIEKTKTHDGSDIKAELIIKEIMTGFLEMKYSYFLKMLDEFKAINPSRKYTKQLEEILKIYIPLKTRETFYKWIYKAEASDFATSIVEEIISSPSLNLKAIQIKVNDHLRNFNHNHPKEFRALEIPTFLRSSTD